MVYPEVVKPVRVRLVGSPVQKVCIVPVYLND